MGTKREWYTCFWVLSFLLASCTLAAQTDISTVLDSLRRRVPDVKGEEKIKTLSHLAWISTRGGDYDQWEKECRLQNDKSALAVAYAARARCLEDMYPDTDSLLHLAEKVMPEIRTPETYVPYNIIYSAVVSHLINTGRIKEAQERANSMLKEARELDKPVAYTLSYYSQGTIFQAIGQYQDAIEAYQRALDYIPDYHKQRGALQSIYGETATALAETYILSEDYENADKVCQTLDDLMANMEKTGHRDVLGCFQVRCYSLQALSYIRQGKLEEAEQLIHYCDGLMLSRISMRWYSDYYIARYQLSVAKKQYVDALADLEICMQNSYGHTYRYYTFLKTKAELLPVLGRGKEGVMLLERYINASDSIYHRDIARQAFEVRTEYKVEELSIQKRHVTWMLLACLLVCWILIVLTVKYIYYNRKLYKKNRVLVENLQRLDAVGGEKVFFEWEAERKAAISQSEEDAVTEEERRLYERIDSHLAEENRFADPQVSRDTLASALGTNRTYIANAVKKCAGLTVNEYVNMLRLEYARNLLVSKPDYSVLMISDEAGFGSVRHFNRLFAVRYGVSPMEYRKSK